MWVITEAMDAEWGNSFRKEYMGDLPFTAWKVGRWYLSDSYPQMSHRALFGDLKGSTQLGWESLSVRESLPSRHGALVSHLAEARHGSTQTCQSSTQVILGYIVRFGPAPMGYMRPCVK